MARFNLSPITMAGGYVEMSGWRTLACGLYALSVSTAPKAVGPQWLEITPPT